MKHVLSTKAMRRRLRRQVAWGRVSLLVMVVMTLTNQLLLALGVEYHFLWSAAAPYYLCWCYRRLGLGELLPALAAVSIAAAYGLCWMLSGRRRGWMAVAFGLYALDTLLLTVFASTLLQDPAACVLEVVIHAVLTVFLAMAVRAQRQLSCMTRKGQLRAEIGTV